MKSAFLLTYVQPSGRYTRGMSAIYISVSTVKISSSMTSLLFVFTLEQVKEERREAD